MSTPLGRRAYRIAYDGGPYRGFQRQPDVPTVEDALFDALRRLELLGPEASKPAGYSAAGRTDAGVSAAAQTVAFECPDWCAPSALNAELPDSIRAWASAAVPEDFHAGLAARRRRYVYHLHAPDAADEQLVAAADRLSGEHDFANLTTDDEGTVRSVAVDLDRAGAFVAVTVAADGFPRQLVRRLVTVLAEVGRGERTLDDVDRILDPEPLAGPEGVEPASPAPLVLADVAYDVDFEVDSEAREDARTAFETRQVDHEARARAAEAVLDGLE